MDRKECEANFKKELRDLLSKYNVTISLHTVYLGYNSYQDINYCSEAIYDEEGYQLSPGFDFDQNLFSKYT